MELKDKILLRLTEGEACGEKLAAEFGVTRAAVWKSVKRLQNEGFNIEAAPNRGYSLKASNVLNAALIERRLSRAWEVTVLNSTTSTNDEAKRLALAGKEFAAVAAESQTAARGRLGRSFCCSKGQGLYISAVLRPKLSAADCGKITAYTAVCSARAVEKLCGAPVQIKWVNDLFMNGKKICGILTEGGVSLEGGNLEYAVVGIGINVFCGDFPEDVAAVATSVEKESGAKIDRCELAAEILNGLAAAETEIAGGGFVEEYRIRSCVIGRRVIVNGAFEAEVAGINDDCSLLVKTDKGTEKLTAGEVSIKVK